MTIAYRGTGGTSTGNTSIAINLPAGVADGDMGVLVVITAEASNTAPNTPSGWTFRGSIAGTSNETFAAGNNTGPRVLSFYTRQMSATDTAFSVAQTGAPTTTSIGGVLHVFSKATTETWNVADPVFGSDTTAGTAVSVTAASNPGITNGDWLLAAFAQPKNATATAEAITATGATIGASTERADFTAAPGTGNRVNLWTWTASATAGTATAAPVITATSSASTTYGVGGLIRLRVQAGGSTTATFDTPNNRVGVTLANWAADQDTTIYRVTPDGVQTPVRGGSVRTSGGSAFVWDYEYPTNVAIYYVAAEADKVRQSSTFTVSDTRSWLRAPGLPGYDMVVRFSARPDRTHARPMTFLTPIGRRTTVPVSDSRKAPTFALSIVTFTDTDADLLLALLANAPVAYVLWPGTDHHGTYVALSDAVEHHVSGKVGPQERTWAITAAEVDRPAGGVVFDPLDSWQSILDTSASWSAVSTAYTSWLDVLQGPYA